MARISILLPPCGGRPGWGARRAGAPRPVRPPPHPGPPPRGGRGETQPIRAIWYHSLLQNYFFVVIGRQGARHRVPDPDGPVGPGRGEAAAVGREGEGQDPAVVARQLGEAGGVEVADPHLAVEAGGGEGPAVGAVGEGEDGPVAAENRARVAG